ncbi:MAG TPA: PQQ-binding-like beta-propeller repeat protein [Armatimonadota bacterium]|jgi:outer membrane protein assembly factor BamB
MVGVVADYLKARRHRLGRHVLFVGSGARIPPEELPLGTHLQTLAAGVVTDTFESLPVEQRPLAQLEAFAAQVPDQAERIRQLRSVVGTGRPAEGHVRLASLIKDGYFPAIFTMEPHALLEQALHNNFMEPATDYHLVVLGVDEPEAVRTALQHSVRVAVVKCGGDLEGRVLPITAAEMREHLAPYREIIADAFQVLATFTAYVDRDRPFLEMVPKAGGKVFWINPTIPLSDRAAFEELRSDEPGAAEYHKLQPEVTSLLEGRQSQRHILAREPGTFNDFFAALGTQLKAHSRRASRGRNRDLSVLRGGPYRFLDYFDVEDAEFFFGREKETEELLELVNAHPLTVLFGKSGSGKTSLLRAGLMARLRELDEDHSGEGDRPLLPVYVACGADPSANLHRALVARAETEGLPLPVEARQAPAPDLALALAETAGRDLVIIVDHLAEIFVKVGAKVREQFVDELRACLDSGRVRILLCVREDYLGELWELRPQLPRLMKNMYRLRWMSREQAELAITKPAANFNIQVERDLTERLLEDLYREGVEPAALQIVMYRLYEEVEKPSRIISGRVYDQLGGAQKILSGYLDKVLLQLPLAERPLARALLRSMVASSELRARRPLARIVQEVGQERETTEKVLAHLVDHKLLRVAEDDLVRSYELAHEYLTEELRRWLGEEQAPQRNLQDLLTRELNNYEKFGSLMEADRLRLLSDHADEVSISPEELELLLRSATATGVKADYWYGRTAELGERRDEVLISLLSEARLPRRLTAYQNLPRELSAAFVPILAAGLNDESPEVRGLAAHALHNVERQLGAFLSSGQPDKKRLAARAIGALGLRKYTRRMFDALADDDPGFATAAAEALRGFADPRLVAQLRKRVENVARAPWAAAEVLGRLAHTDQEVSLLERSSQRFPDNPKLLLALGRAELEARHHPEALGYLQRAAALTTEARGQALVREVLAEAQARSDRPDLASDNWPTFAGSARHDGRAPGEMAPPLEQIWATRTGGPVVASPVVGRAMVYVGSRDGVFYALDSARGDLRWSFETDGRIEGTAALTEEGVFFGSTDQMLYAADPARGQLRWRRELLGPLRGGCTVLGDMVLAADMAGHMSAWGQTEGDLRWNFATAGEIFSTPAADRGLVVFGSWDSHLYAIGAENGREVWRFSTGGPVASSPTLGDKLAWCGSDDGHLYAVALDSGKQVWAANLRGRVRATPALSATSLVVGSGDGGVYCLEQATGKILWRTQTGDEVLASALIVGSVVYVGSKDGALYALDVATGEVLWKNTTSYGIYSSPAVAEGTLFLGFDYYYVTAFRGSH